MKTLTWMASLIVVVALGACASIDPPRNVQDSIAYGYTAVAAARSTTATLLESKRIALDDARQVQAIADQARALLDAARVAWTSGNQIDAQQRLQLAQSVLTQLNTYLMQREKAP